MPRSAKIGSYPSNAYDGTAIVRFVNRAEAVQAEIDGIMEDANDACQALRADLAKAIKDAAAAGFANEEFRAVLKARRLERKRDAVADSLAADQLENFKAMMDAIGQLAGMPLGDAAVRGAAAR